MCLRKPWTRTRNEANLSMYEVRMMSRCVALRSVLRSLALTEPENQLVLEHNSHPYLGRVLSFGVELQACFLVKLVARYGESKEAHVRCSCTLTDPGTGT